MQVKIKKLHPDAKIPSYAKFGDAGQDLYAVSKAYDEYGNIVYGTGLAFEIPEGYCMLLFPRSSNARTDLVLSNHVGIADSGYRGEVFFKYAKYYRHYTSPTTRNEEYQIGEKIGQVVILPYPQIHFEEVEELSKSERGAGGYGSTGK